MARRNSPDLFIPCSEEQAAAADAIREKDLVFLVGPGGTGKTHIAAVMAAEWMKKQKYGRIVIARPARGGGEQLGYLPGTREEKIAPYLKPLMRIFDELEDCDDGFKAKAQREHFIEFATFEHMRGETYANCFVIGDEMQNATVEQMKMFLTRLGKGSKMVVTGDLEQIDLPRHIDSGLAHILPRAANIAEASIHHLTSEASNFRHPIVTQILAAYR